jgi:hypothetical protein
MGDKQTDDSVMTPQGDLAVEYGVTPGPLPKRDALYDKATLKATMDESQRAWAAGDHSRAHDLWHWLLEHGRMSPSARVVIEHNMAKSSRALYDKFAEYPVELVARLGAERAERVDDAQWRVDPGGDIGTTKTDAELACEDGLVTLLVLTCRRYDLFTRTMNSFLRCCEDLHLIGRYVCVDDNSHPHDRAAMRAIYPFMEFIEKTPEQTGHPQSMNMAAAAVRTPYVLVLEDDWLFVRRTPLVGRCLAVLAAEAPNRVMQVFFNRHYIEVPDAPYLSLTGGIHRHDPSGRRYIVHEHHARGTREYEAYCARHPANFAHQPHYSLRPGVYRTAVWRLVGRYNEVKETDEFSYFENEYARRYAAAGLRSAFLDGVYCEHIGRLNRDKHNPNAAPNAYQLNAQIQYGQEWPHNAPPPKKLPGERVALTVTTCRRPAAFIASMRSLLAMCTDPSAVDAFIGVDDNSSPEDRAAMRAAFPFFRWIDKDAAQRGHARSMNIIVDELRAGRFDYALHTEDDWHFATPFSIGKIIVAIRASHNHHDHRCATGSAPAPATTGRERRAAKRLLAAGEGAPAGERATWPQGWPALGQVVLLPHAWCRGERVKVGQLELALHRHVVGPRLPVDIFAPCLEAAVPSARLREVGEAAQGGKGPGCWWPSLTLNPGVWHVPSVLAAARAAEGGHLFDESIEPGLFEYAASLRAWLTPAWARAAERSQDAATPGDAARADAKLAGFGVAHLATGVVSHMDGVSAYVLNHHMRSFDARACGNHRPTGLDPQCPHCAQHRAAATASAATAH